MRQREYIQKQIDRLEGKLNHIDSHASRNDITMIKESVTECKRQLEEIRASIDREPMSADELNKF